MSKDFDEIKEILAEIEKAFGMKAEYIPERGRHSKVRIQILGTTQDFPIPTKEFSAGRAKKNFYSQMRRRINDRIEAVKARHSITA
jgi:hypothetical protein